jgi:hypothetical protein
MAALVDQPGVFVTADQDAGEKAAASFGPALA